MQSRKETTIKITTHLEMNYSNSYVFLIYSRNAAVNSPVINWLSGWVKNQIRSFTKQFRKMKKVDKEIGGKC